MNRDGSEEHLEFLEDSRAALAEALRFVSLESAARALDTLPRPGVDGWGPAWIVGLGFAKAVAERWSRAVREASTRAVTDKDCENLVALVGELATVVKDAIVLVARTTNPDGA